MSWYRGLRGGLFVPASLFLGLACHLLLAAPCSSLVLGKSREAAAAGTASRTRGAGRSPAPLLLLSRRVRATVRRQDPDSEDVAPAPGAPPSGKHNNIEVANVSVPDWALHPPPKTLADLNRSKLMAENDIVCAWRASAPECLENAVCAWWQQRSPTVCDSTKERCGTCHQWSIYAAGDINECRQYEAVVEKYVMNEVDWGQYCGTYFGYKCDVICPGDRPNITQHTGPDPMSIGTPEGRVAKMREDLQKHCEEHDWLIEGCVRDPTGVLLPAADAVNATAR